MKFEKAELEIIMFSTEDVMTTSLGSKLPGFAMGPNVDTGWSDVVGFDGNGLIQDEVIQ